MSNLKSSYCYSLCPFRFSILVVQKEGMSQYPLFISRFSRNTRTYILIQLYRLPLLVTYLYNMSYIIFIL